jgi:hypothetical protein
MGILDDAIREHLDLKRRLGADDDELAKLEGEAFGPATRPGDPDFPDQPPTGETAVGPDTVEAQFFDAEAGPATDESPVAEVVEAPVEAPAEAPAEPPVQDTVEAPIQDATVVPDVAEMPAEPPAEVAPEPPHAIEPEPPPPEPELPLEEELPDAAVPLARELRAIVEPTTGENEIRPEDDLDLDLDLELDALESEPGADPTPTPIPAPAPAAPPIETQDTVEHHFEGAIEDTSDIEVVEGEVADEPRTGEEEQVEGDEEEDEDVLEETPEFLRDQPEDDELWFEQGSPKDFDF